MIKGILFDVDGVLIDSEELLRDAYVEVFAHRNIVLNRKAFEKATGTGDEETIAICASMSGAKIDDVETFKKELYEVEYPKAIKGVLKPFPGVYRFINMAKKAGLKLAVATSGEMIKLKSSMKEIGFELDVFDSVSTRDMVKRAKPAPDLYLKAAEGLNLTGDECLVFEDAYSGIQSGRAAGCRCLGLTSSFSKEVLYENGAEIVIDSMMEIPEFKTIEEFNRIIDKMAAGVKNEKSCSCK